MANNDLDEQMIKRLAWSLHRKPSMGRVNYDMICVEY